MAAVAWIASHLSGVGVLLAVRHLSRSPGFYAAPLMLLVLTLSLSAYTASVAKTLDSHLVDQTFYRVGADINLLETGESPFASGGPSFGGGGEAEEEPAEVEEEEETGPYWYFLPVSEHLSVDGVEAAARVGRYNVSTRLSGSRQAATVIGIDRVDFPKVAFWRWRSDLPPHPIRSPFLSGNTRCGPSILPTSSRTPLRHFGRWMRLLVNRENFTCS